MTIEGDILKKLESIKKEIKVWKKVDNTNSENGSTKRKEKSDVRDGTKTHSSTDGGSAVLFLFDATGSMQSLWDETREIIKEMVERITNVGNVKIKCVAYRDYCDGDKIFECSKWHTDAEPLLNFIKRIKCDGGGDTPEAVEDALKLAYEEKEKVTRVILIGDAPPHSLEKAQKESINLDKKGIPVFAFRVGEDYSTKIAFSDIAKLSNGNYADLRNYRDLLDMVSVTILHDVGGSEEVEKYIKKYDTSDDVKKFSQSLPPYPKK